MKDPEDEAFEELTLKQGQWEHTSGWRKKQILETSMTQNTIEFRSTSDNTWVMRITADRKIEVNEDVDVTAAAQKVLDAMQFLLKAQRKPLTDDLYNELLFAVGNKYPNETRHQTALRYILQAEKGDEKAAHGIKENT